MNRQSSLQTLVLAMTMAAIAMTSYSALASNKAISQHMSAPQLVGKARMKVMLWNVFDGELFTSSGQYNETEPFALRLSYLRKLKSQNIVEKTIEEIQRQDQATSDEIERWTTSLKAIIPDVVRGTAITGVRTANANTVFYNGDQFIGRIDDPVFSRLFFNIWLGKESTEPMLRNKLIGAEPQI